MTLCASCALVRSVANNRGSAFFLCTLNASDPRYAKYPRQPVVHCAGYEPRARDGPRLDGRQRIAHDGTITTAETLPPHKELETMAMAERRADVTWKGDLMNGAGVLTFASSGLAKEAPVTWASRTEAPDGRTSPEELLAAALASCFAMAFSNGLAKAGTPPEELQVSANAHLDRKPEGGVKVSLIELSIRGKVPGISAADFAAAASAQVCPISATLAGNVEIKVSAELIS